MPDKPTMTALNQAIIKAYLRQGGRRVCREEEATEGETEVVTSPEPQHAVRPEQNLPRPPHLHGEAKRPPSVPFDALGITGLGLRAEFVEAIGCPVASGVGEGDTPPEPETARDHGQAVPPREIEAKSAAVPLVPLLRVDTFSWPRPSRRLRQLADKQIERFADTVQRAAISGRKLIGVASASCGEGCTTVLLSVALRLVELERSVLLLDGDVEHPRLAEQLALANEVGWRDVVDGFQRIEEAVTQSETQSVALLPYSGPATCGNVPGASTEALQALVRRIRAQYDIVLIDLGATLQVRGPQGTLGEKLAEQIDSVIIVRHVELTSLAQLADFRRRLKELGVEEAGIIENFVRPATMN